MHNPWPTKNPNGNSQVFPRHVLALALVTFTVAARGSLFSNACRRHRSMVEDLVEDEVFCLGKCVFMDGKMAVVQ